MQTNLIEVPSITTPLYYIGSKKKLQKHLLPYTSPINKYGSVVCPFIGGGSIELLLSSLGFKVYASDINPLLVNFWNVLLSRAEQLNDLTVEYWNTKHLNEQWWTEIYNMEPLEQAAIFWVVNRSSYMGVGFGDNPKCLTRETPTMNIGIIKSFKNFKSPNLFVEVSDYKESLKKYDHLPAYMDPPYIDQETYYNTGSFDHQQLHSILSNRSVPWLLSYNDHDLVKELYSDFYINKIPWISHMSNEKTRYRYELLISNFTPN